MDIEKIAVEAPFAIPQISIPDFQNCPQFPITKFGASPNSLQKNIAAFEQAIAAAEGGGRVIVPAGEWQCAKIHLKSGVNLHLEEGATLLFSERPEDYLPPVKTSWEGLECLNYSPLIYAHNCEYIAISGRGKLKAKLDVWQRWYARPPAHLEALVKLYYLAVENEPVEKRDMTYEGANLRPHFIQFNRCKHVLMEDISIEDSPFWVIHPYLCEELVIRRVKVKAHGHNNDGVDPEMTQNMLIEDCVFDQGDDAISVKSGREFEAWRINVATRNIVMRNCRVKKALQLLAVGSELSGGIENILVEHCQFEDGQQLQEKSFGNLLFIKTNERRGGFVKNIYLRHIEAEAVAGGALCLDSNVLYQWRSLVPTLERRLTVIEGVFLSDIVVQSASFICRIEGDADCPVKKVELKNVTADRLHQESIINTNVDDFLCH